jgi:hypothetical protein
VYCDFYDGRAFTLYEMMSNTMHSDGLIPYNARDKTARHPQKDSNLGKMFEANQNQCARYEVVWINSIFKHSEGYVMTRWNNNKDEFHVTDIFGTPEGMCARRSGVASLPPPFLVYSEVSRDHMLILFPHALALVDGKHIFAEEHDCSQKDDFNLAMAYRQRPNGVNNGYCFTNGKINQDNNCVCGDRHSGDVQWNRCAGDYGNWRRYNGRINRNLFCSTLYSKCVFFFCLSFSLLVAGEGGIRPDSLLNQATTHSATS